MSRKIASAIVLSLLLIVTSLSAFNVQLIKAEDGLLLEMNLNKTVIAVGEKIDITLTLRNIGDTNVTITFTPPLFDVCYYVGAERYCWSYGKAFIQVILDLILEPEESYAEILQWDLYKYVDGEYYPPEPGTYDLYGGLHPTCWTGCHAKVTLVDPNWNPADVNSDFKVDIYDVVLLCLAYNCTPSDSHWNPHCDIAEPYDIININDVVLMCASYGEEWSDR
jgi:hypothetical protein